MDRLIEITEMDAKYSNKIKELENLIMNSMIASYAWNNDSQEIFDDKFKDNFNNYFNEINYTFTRQFLKLFHERNMSLVEEFNKEFYDIKLVEKAQRSKYLLDFYLNKFAWNNLAKIIKEGKQ